ncbi:hypothetical protein AVEN_152917-1 [Araneus ventricosus]|uniref:Uncharacterized protein n=1 Tax=Araneus ventricosus TaxID=182803 RepID=A0A4Y2AEP8_ARAVE|nr:hypothetical protein AVEN_152917-1 [Araneus ventricosus]
MKVLKRIKKNKRRRESENRGLFPEWHEDSFEGPVPKTTARRVWRLFSTACPTTPKVTLPACRLFCTLRIRLLKGEMITWNTVGNCQ